MNFKENKSDIIGIFFFIMAFFVFAFMMYVYVKYPFSSIDEGFTRGIVNLSIPQMIDVTAIDVHPPFYYLVVMGLMSIVNLLNINIELIYVMKFAAIIPCVLLLILSFTKIKKDYGLLTAGVFSFLIMSMSEFFMFYITARMYSWAILFLILSFLCVKEILLEESNFKYWILLAIFSVLGAYTHYFAAISSIVLYVILFVYLVIKHKLQIKEFFASVILGVLLYAPWVLILLGQLKSVHNHYHIKQVTVTKLISCFSYAFTISNNHLIQILSLILFFVILLIFIRYYIKSRNQNDFYLMLGILVFLGTVGLGTLISFTFKPILTERYLIPAIAVFLLCISIKLGNIKRNNILILILVGILFVGAFNLYHEYEDVMEEYDNTLYEDNVLSKINNNDSVILCDSVNRYIRTCDYLNETYDYYGVYTINNESHFLKYSQFNDINYENFDIPNDLDKYPYNHFYLITFNKSKLKDGDGFKLNEIGEVQHSKIFEIIPQ